MAGGFGGKGGGGNPLGSVAGAWSLAVNQMTQALGQFNSQVGQFVKAFNPAELVPFERAVRDLYGSVGELLVPVMQEGTRIVRFFADTIAGLAKDIMPVLVQGLRAVRPVLDGIATAIRNTVAANAGMQLDVYARFGEMIQALAPSVLALLPPLAQVSQALVSFQTGIAQALIDVLVALAAPLEAVVSLAAGLVSLALAPLTAALRVIGPLLRVLFLPLTVALEVASAPLKLVGGLIQEFGSLVGGLAGEIGAVAGEVVNIVRDVLKELVALVGELLKPVADLFRQVMGMVGDALRWAVEQLRGFVAFIRDLFGIPAPEAKKFEGESDGKGAPKSTSTTTVSQMLAKLQESAFGSPTNAMAEVKNNTARATNHLEQISNFLNTNLAPVLTVISSTLPVVANTVGAGVRVATAPAEFVRDRMAEVLDEGRKRYFGG